MEYQIQSRHLTLDEFLVECETRQIKGSVGTQFEQLDRTLSQEQADPQLIPTRPTVSASKAPHREVATCAKKLKLLQATLQEGLADGSDSTDCDVYTTRIAHVYYRLRRIAASPSAHKDASNLLQTCADLLDVVNKFKTGEDSGDVSITRLTAVNINYQEMTEEPGDKKAVPEAVDEQLNPISAYRTLYRACPLSPSAAPSISIKPPIPH